MGNSTWSGPIRSKGGFQEVSENSTTGAVSVIARPVQIGTATGVTVNTTAGDSDNIGEWTQPANTLITDIKVWCVAAPTVTAAGDIGYEVGSTSSGAELVAAQTDEILDLGTTVVINNITLTTLVVQTQDGTTAPASVQYTSTARTVYCNITNTTDATTAGSFTFLIEYITLA